ncbi:MAG: DsrE family protein [Deltaproteobacteria bacterium]|nr:DsrE family protein [Deltaproteobacteria bacterium]MBW2117131.1 DsrE family protein [Deltaproteobacteria bacterium]MBW2342746.1 DsrE family protein [Deltaproteobacteria bacterium]
MADTETEKIVYLSTNGPENPEKASLPFVLANAALVMDVEALIVLQGPSVFLAKKGIIEHVHAAGFAPLKELLESFLEQGGKLAVCVPCIQERKIDETDLIEKAEPMAGGTLTLELLSANATLVY